MLRHVKHPDKHGMFNDFPRTKLTKAATVTLKHSRSCGLRSQIWIRSRVQAFEIRVIPTFPVEMSWISCGDG